MIAPLGWISTVPKLGGVMIVIGGIGVVADGGAGDAAGAGPPVNSRTVTITGSFGVTKITVLGSVTGGGVGIEGAGSTARVGVGVGTGAGV